VSGLRVDPALHDFVTAELVPGSGVTAEQVWDGLAELVRTFAPRHRDVLAVRDRLQGQIDGWHRSHPAGSHEHGRRGPRVVPHGGFLRAGQGLPLSC
jgi:malate synthase